MERSAEYEEPERHAVADDTTAFVGTSAPTTHRGPLFAPNLKRVELRWRRARLRFRFWFCATPGPTVKVRRSKSVTWSACGFTQITMCTEYSTM